MKRGVQEELINTKNKNQKLNSGDVASIALLDLKMFAHVLNDPDLSGSPLEGSSLATTLTYFDNFLDRLLDGKIVIDGIIPEKEMQLRTACKHMKDIISVAAKFTHIEIFEDKNELAKAVDSIVEELALNNGVILPGGWVGRPGHAMLYEFRSDGLFLIWNTGAGINYHLSEESKKGMQYQPVKAYQLPKETIQSKLFQQSLCTILEPGLQVSRRFDEDSLYERIDNEMIFLKAKEVDPTPFVKEMILDQFSGTCAWQVIASLARNYGFKDLNFEEIYYEAMRYTLTQAVTSLNLKSPDVQNQFCFAIKNFASTLKNLAKSGVLSIDRQQQGLNLIKDINTTIHQSIVNEKCTSNKSNYMMEKVQLVIHTVISNLANYFSSLFDNQSISKNARRILELHQFNNIIQKEENLNYALFPSIADVNSDELMKLITQAIESEVVAEHLTLDIKNIENILLNIPLSASYWEGCTVDEIFNYVKLLEKLTLKYCQLCQSLDRFSFAERTLAVHSVAALLAVFTDKIFGKDSSCALAIRCANETYNISQTTISNNLKKLDHNAFFSLTTVPLFKRQQEVLDILSQESSTKQTAISAIASTDDSLQNEASTASFPFKYKEQELPGIYYYLCNFDEKYKKLHDEKHGKSMAERYPEIENRMQFYISCITLRNVCSQLVSDKINIIQCKLPEDMWKMVRFRVNTITAHAEFEVEAIRNYSELKESKLSISHVIHDKQLLLDLIYTRIEPNQIQIQIGKHAEALSKKMDTRRRLQHILANGESQVVAAIEYLRCDLTQLENYDVRQFLFMSLLQGGYLSIEITDNPKVIDTLLATIETGLEYYSARDQLEIAMFFMQMNVFLYQYLASAPKSTITQNQIERAAEINKGLNPLIQKLKMNKKYTPSAQKSVSKGLYLHIIMLAVKQQLCGLVQLEWAEFFTLQALLNQANDQDIDPFIFKEMQNAQVQLKCAVASANLDQEFFDETADNILDSLGIPFEQKEDYTVNLLEGTVKNAGVVLQNIPRILYKNVAFEKLFSTEAILARRLDDKTYLFTYQNEQYRIQGDVLNLIVQKEITLDGKTQWIQWIENPNKLFMKLGSTIDENSNWEYCSGGIPCTLGDKTKQYWQTEMGSYVVTQSRSSRILYYFYEADKKRTDHRYNHFNINMGFKLGEAGEALYQWLPINNDYHFVTQFEDSRFIEIWRDLTTQQVHIYLPRYDLHFYSQSNNTWGCEQFPGYILNTESVTPLAHFHSALELLPAAFNKEPKCYLIPKQEFLPTKRIDEDFYQYDLDIHDEVNVANKLGRQCSDYTKRLVKQNSQRDTIPSEKYAVLLALPDGILQTKTIEDTFFLAYIYFANRQPEQAFSLLRKEMYSWHDEVEIKHYLTQIFENTPSNILGSNLASDTRHNGPEYTAVRALVACLLVEHWLKKDANSFSDEEKEAQKKAVINVLNQYSKIKEHIPNKMRLNEDELLTLISFTRVKKKEHFVKRDESFHLQYYRKNIRLQQRLTESHAKHINRFDAISKAATIHRDKLNKKIAKTYTLKPIKYELGSHKKSIRISEVKGFKTLYFHSPVNLKISDLVPTINHDKFKDNLIYLFDEAMSDEYKFFELNHFLDTQIKIILKDKKEYLQCKPDMVRSVLLLKSMLLNKDKVNKYRYNYYLLSFEAAQFINNISNEQFTYELSCFEPIENDSSQIHIPSEPVITSNFEASSSSESEDEMVIEEKPELTSNFVASPSSESKEEIVIEVLKNPTVNLFEKSEADIQFVSMLIDEANQDYEAGKQLNQQSRIAHSDLIEQLMDGQARNDLYKMFQESIENLQIYAQNYIQELEALANQKPTELNECIQWECGFFAKTIDKLTIDDLLLYFGKYTAEEMADKRKINGEEGKRWHELMKKYLVVGTDIQKMNRANKIIEEMAKLQSHEMESKKSLAEKLAQTVMQQRAFDPNQHPFILLFEYLEDKLIYENQYQLLCSLLEKNEFNAYFSKVIQLIMGGGKSKILLPLLAKLRPTGENLVIIEVSSTLFDTNFADLSAVSAKLGQKAHPFLFHRNLNCDADYFYQLREKLRRIKANKEYIVTTRQSIDSLNLKYILLVTQADENNPEWQKQVDYLDEIVNMLQIQGDVIIDEVDSNLHPKDQLIYMVSEGKSIDKHLLQSLMALYRFTSQAIFSKDDTQNSLYDILTGKIEQPGDEIQKELFSSLVDKLVSEKKSPLKDIVAKIEPKHHPKLIKFFHNQFRNSTDHIPKFKTLSKQEKEILALYKEELTSLLPLSVKKDCNVHFGLSKDKNKDEIEQEVAIPYVGNNKPVETSKFQNHFLTINYTIQAQLQKALSIHIFKLCMQNFKTQFDVESNLNAFRVNKTTGVADKFKQLLPELDISLDKIDLESEQQMTALYQQLKDNPVLKEYCISEYILPTILSMPVTVTANSQNHISGFRSSIGFTGTDYNYRTFHPSIQRDNSQSFGTDGQTLDHLLNQKAPVHLLQTNHYKALFDHIHQHPNSGHIRAIMDTGALFKGIPNRDVANMLSVQYANTGIRYILYFEDNTLCALKTSTTPENEIPIVLGSSDNIAQKLDCSLEQYFTYYDQVHTTGVDIKQAANTIGIVTIGGDNTLRDLLQSAMRLRDIKGTHRAEFCVMTSLSSKHNDIPPDLWNIKTLVNLILRNQAKALLTMHLTAAFQKLHNVFREEALTLIKNAQLRSEKVLLAKAFTTLLYDKDNTPLFEKFAAPLREIPLAILLNNQKQQLFDKWQQCISQTEVSLAPLTDGKLKFKCDEIIKQTLPICEPMQMSSGLYASLDNLVMIHRENQNQREQENHKQVESVTTRLSRYKSWEKSAENEWNLQDVVKLLPLEDLIKKDYPSRTWQYSEQIFVSENFYNTLYHFQDKENDLTNVFKKPCYFVMRNKDGLHVMITQEEAAEIRTLSAKYPVPANIWIETPNGVPYLNCRAHDLPKSYQSDMEQILYFNADINYLAANVDSLKWLVQQSQDKLDFLDNAIAPYHPSKVTLMPTLRERIQNKSSAIMDTKKIKNPKKAHYEVVEPIAKRLRKRRGVC